MEHKAWPKPLDGPGRKVPGSRYSPDMSKHAFFGTNAAIPDKYRERKTEI
jgi:betaine-homocysteine S-methyltransferase